MKQHSNSNSHLLRSISLVIAVVTWAGLASAADQRQRADAGMAALQNFYNPSTGLFNTPAGWWQAANALETTIDFSARANTDLYTSDIATTFNKNRTQNFLNNYYDDEGWWALTWIKAYDLTGNTDYLNSAKTIFSDMAGGWDTTCSGGIWWSKDRTYKNAIANELFLTVAGRLHNRTPGDGGPLIETANGSGGTVLTGQQLENLPMNGRQVYTLLGTTPGSQFLQTQFGAQGYSGTRAWDTSNNYTPGGSASGYQQFTLDGTNVTLQAHGAQGTWQIAPNVDALQEVNVMTTTYDARYGRTAAEPSTWSPSLEATRSTVMPMVPGKWRSQCE